MFPDDKARDAHLAGPVAVALKQRGDELFAKPPSIQKLSVLADKLPKRPEMKNPASAGFFPGGSKDYLSFPSL